MICCKFCPRDAWKVGTGSNQDCHGGFGLRPAKAPDTLILTATRELCEQAELTKRFDKLDGSWGVEMSAPWQ